MADLLNCAVCGGKVSSDAISCPHCGTQNFKSNDYLRMESLKRENEIRRQQIAHAEKMKELGEPVDINIKQKGTFGSLTQQRIAFYIDDRHISAYFNPDTYPSDSGPRYRLKKGSHIMKLVSNETKTHITTMSFQYNGERNIDVVYKGNNTGFFRDNTRYWLDSVTVH